MTDLQQMAHQTGGQTSPIAFPNARKFAKLTKDKRDLEARLKQVNGELDKLAPMASDELIQNGVPRLPIDGMLLYFARLINASAAGQDPRRMRRAFARIGLGDLISPKPNVQAIKSHILERLNANLPVENVVSKYVRWQQFRQLRCIADSGMPLSDSLDEALGEPKID